MRTHVYSVGMPFECAGRKARALGRRHAVAGSTQPGARKGAFRTLPLHLFAAALALVALSQPPCGAQEAPRFVPVAEGTMDLETGLVWGFDLFSTNEYLRDIGIHETAGWHYTWYAANAQILSNTDENGDPVPGGFATYTEFSNWYANRDDSDWRLPTKNEMMTAASAGLAAYLDTSPAAGLQLLPPAPIPDAATFSQYSSTLTKYRGMENVYVVDLRTAVAKPVSLNSGLTAFLVRGAPPPADSGPGKGKKK